MSDRVISHLGVYTEEEFLDPEAREMVIAEMRVKGHERAKVFDREWNYVEDEGYRSTLKVKVGERVNAFVRAKLLERRSLLSERFGVELADCQEISYLIYKPGDFFELHRDTSANPNAPATVRARRVSVIVFLRDEETDVAPGECAGGSLAFYGLLKDPRCAHIGIPVRGKAGLLVAFRSDVFHQVTPLTRGERFTIVTWFY